jgi:hypothetical protein
MVAPEVPGSSAVGQAVLGDQADGHALHAERVEGFGQGQVRQVDGEAATAAEAAMAGERDNQVHRAIGTRVTPIVQRARRRGITAGAARATGTAPRGEVAAAPLDARLGKILNAGNPLGRVWDILAWSGHRWTPDERLVRRTIYELTTDSELGMVQNGLVLGNSTDRQRPCLARQVFCR